MNFNFENILFKEPYQKTENQNTENQKTEIKRPKSIKEHAGATTKLFLNVLSLNLIISVN